jgi:hypothetical protein
MGPALVFSDPTHAVFFADMTGDGLTDIVRVRCGEVCYWPNHGYGRFGPKVTMDGAPVFDTPDLFEPRRVRFADIDGSMTSPPCCRSARSSPWCFRARATSSCSRRACWAFSRPMPLPRM